MNILNLFGGVTRILQMAGGALITIVGVSIAIAGSKTGQNIGGAVATATVPEVAIPAKAMESVS